MSICSELSLYKHVNIDIALYPEIISSKDQVYRYVDKLSVEIAFKSFNNILHFD